MIKYHKSASIATEVGEVKPESFCEAPNRVKADMSDAYRNSEQLQDHATVDQEIRTSVIRSFSEIENIRQFWSLWQNHPNADIDFYLTNADSNRGFVRPHILVLQKGSSSEAILIGRIEDRQIECKIGYKTLLRPKARIMNFIYAGVLGNLSLDMSKALVTAVLDSLRQGEADLAYFNLLRTDHPLYQAVVRSG
jgi:hypothetical protein